MGSTQDTRERRVKVLRGPHDDARFQDGQVVSVLDLTDHQAAGVEKTMYVHRFISIQPDVQFREVGDKEFEFALQVLKWGGVTRAADAGPLTAADKRTVVQIAQEFLAQADADQ
jgi:hypothetical protein